jgi:hypothetical protein
MLISFWCFQIGDQACKGNAALWASWHWKNSYGSSNWKNAEWEGAKGLELIPWFSSLCMFVCLLICQKENNKWPFAAGVTRNLCFYYLCLSPYQRVLFHLMFGKLEQHFKIYAITLCIPGYMTLMF